MRLDNYTSRSFTRGANRLTEMLWILISGVLVESWLPGSSWRIGLLRVFGARIGTGCVIKPHTKIKFPWKLMVGNYCWIGEFVWIDNLAEVSLGDHVCLSQNAYIGTGSHDWERENFDLITLPVTIESHAWVCARASIAPGAVLREGAVLGMGQFGSGCQEAWTIRTHKGLRSRPRNS